MTDFGMSQEMALSLTVEQARQEGRRDGIREVARWLDELSSIHALIYGLAAGPSLRSAAGSVRELASGERPC